MTAPTLADALRKIAGYTLSQFMGPHDMALACVDTARAALAAADAAKPQGEAVPVAWCALTPNGQIAYFDGRPMVMPGPVGNEMHTTPLYPHPAPSAPAVQPSADSPPPIGAQIAPEHAEELDRLGDEAVRRFREDQEDVERLRFIAECERTVATNKWLVQVLGPDGSHHVAYFAQPPVGSVAVCLSKMGALRAAIDAARARTGDTA